MAEITRGNCLLCGKECDKYRNARYSFYKYTCDTCGHYAVRDGIFDDNPKLMASMFYYLLHKNPQGKYIFFTKEDGRDKDNSNIPYVGVKTLESLYPSGFSQRVDMILMNLSKLYRGFGEEIEVNMRAAEMDSTLLNATFKMALFIESGDNYHQAFEIIGTLSLLTEMGLLVYIKQKIGYIECYKISAKGWQRIEELTAQNKVIPQGFIAMWFDEKMNSAREKIIDAVRENGYTPMIIDDKQHNNQIVPEIFYEIKQSTFVVADLTGHRNGVYYEAGYAQALGKEVILTCKASEFEDRHFDIAQINIIKWDDEEDLYRRLVKRIEATVGKIN